MRVLLFLICLSVSAAMVVAEGTPTLVVFVPEEATVTLVSPEGVQDLPSRAAQSQEIGPVEVQVSLVGFETYSRSLNLTSGQQVVLIPRLRPSSESRLALKETLLKQKNRALAQKDNVSLAAFGAGVAALAGWSSVGVLEWSLANKKAQLSDARAAYRAASVDQAASTWATVEALKADIGKLRTYEAYAAATSGGLSLGALALWLLGPDTGQWDDDLRRLEEKGL